MPESTQTAVKDSILESTKHMVGLDESYDAFDLDVTTHINSAFSTLYQVGVGPIEGYIIQDKNNKWTDFIGNRMDIENVKSYVYSFVRLRFDPPTSSFGLEALQKQLDEYIWRLNVAADFTVVEVPPPVIS